MKGSPVLSLLLLCICSLYFVGLYLFMGGFLLVRLEVNRTSTCGDVLQPGQEPVDFCHARPRFRRAVLIIIDALKIDFAQFDSSNLAPRPYENKLPVVEEITSSRPLHSRLYPFHADPPTTTMQRIKGFTTGSLPTFVDVGNNFASSAILEDNLIHQLGQIGKRVVFMGDDTWESLFPKKFYRCLPFPSFNVKDLHTVDNGILQNLYSTMTGNDWDVLVAHFLGVDHCGHRFGPDHPAMADKLTQMDGVIRSVIDRLQNDTLLVVMGDHGMTDTGDHGGESQKETDAALFLYSPVPLFPGPPSKDEPDIVPQTDLVPSLALLLGIPIPYSSVGQVLLPLFPPHDQAEVAPTGPSQLEALWINVKQVNRFLETYSSMAKDIPPPRLSQLKAEFARLSSEYLATVGVGRSPSPQLTASMQAYLTSVRETCRATWARFNPLKMAAGLVILAFACLMCYVLSELSFVLIRENARRLKAPAVVALAVGVCVAVGQLLTHGYIEVAWCLAAAALSTELLFFWSAYRTRTVHVAKNGSKPPKWTNWLTRRRLLIPPILVAFLRCASLLSDSYVIAEGRVVTFLLLSLVVYTPVHLNWDGLLLPPSYDPLKSAGLLPSPALSPSFVKKESSTLLACVGLLVGSLYLSLSFHGCREEQGYCQPSPFLTPLSRLQDSQMKNLHYALSVVSLGVWTYLLRHWLRHYGNLNSSGGAVFTARWILPLLSTCLGLHWAVSATPEDSFRNLGEMIKLAQLLLPRAAFCLLVLGLFLICLDPLTVFIKTRATASARNSSLPLPRYRASTGISPQAELHHLIPQIYQRMRRSLDDSEPSVGSEVDNRPAVEAYGLGTVYSAPLLLFCGLLALGMLLLHPEGMALSFLLLLLEMGALLHIHASATTLRGLQSTYSGGFNVPWAPIVMWSLAATQFFHATGHLPTFPSIQWSAAFVGFPDGHTGTAVPASLVTLNTFASHILFAVSCPLLLFWPLVCEARGSRGGRAASDEGEDAVMEMRLRENPQQFSSALLQLSTRYLFILGAQVFASVSAAAILRRHLMVWKVFAPKLIFEALGFVLSSVSVVIGVTLVLRVDVAVARWFKKLIPDSSR
ncbi:GPI ethanolamine phosphate transferase 3 [Solea solea]|uniref:GPI ethanolamine phosphate transferase 3 n=1 Tax=Solea solea TaxID=90069 RepID=UPI00272BA146|nr:GPI ethanolamine phosphate transferase 3 [Solea solea]XP_058473862.1 GPI ethanolamine phosphate transferase 3 [Solea solea]XP_058473863.1 GPI ethanolamine phosphate transferase 3 [Solea solea]